ncbi:MAG TPA: hypothetical protein VH593_01905 [Ktedonobacteraceae bacterium]
MGTMSAGEVQSCHKWRDNAALINDVRKLGYLHNGMAILDATYGRGGWWREWNPPSLVRFAGDFTDLPYEDGDFDAVVFDPPYVSIGGRETSGLKEKHARYGNDRTPKSPLELQRVMNVGLHECRRVVVVGGLVLMKCMDYVSSGRMWMGTYWTVHEAFSMGMTVVDKFVYVNNGSPQPRERMQIHSRSNYSVLYVFRT